MTSLKSWLPSFPLNGATSKTMIPTVPLIASTLLAGIAYAGACLALYSYQNKLIFRPLPQLIRTPAELGLAYEDIWIPINDGAECLHAWWLPNPGHSSIVSSKNATMLFCHGNYGNISYNTERIRFYHSLGFSVLAFDYRGYGQSTPTTPSEEKTYADAEAAWQYLTTTRELSPHQITICGHSMGGAVAIDLAAQHPTAAKLIVESSFTTMKDAIDAKKIYGLFPIEQLLSHPFDSLSKVKTLQVPVLYVHGDQDFDVPAEFSKRLYGFTPCQKQIWIASGADHNNISNLQGDSYAAAIAAFYEEKKTLQSIA
ncbi:MAG: alpha/beta hydrolase [Cyanobacteria bacterium J06649_4]